MVTKQVIEITIAIIAVALLFPIAGNLIFNANTTGWDSTSKTVFTYIFTIGIVAILVGILYTFLQHRKSRG